MKIKFCLKKASNLEPRRLVAGSFLLMTLFSFQAFALGQKIDLVDASLLDAIRILSQSTGVNMVLSGDTQTLSARKVTVHLKDVSYSEALLHILESYGIRYKWQGQTLVVSGLSADQSGTAFDLEFINFNLQFIEASRVKEILAKLMPEANSEIGQQSCQLVVSAKPWQIEKIKKLIQQFDKPVRQVALECKVIEISQSGMRRLGVSYENYQGGLKFLMNKDTRKISLASDISIVVQALVANGDANILAHPNLTVEDGQSAQINIGSKIPYAVPVTNNTSTQWKVDYIDAGVSLKITPKITENKMIHISLKPEVSAVSEWRMTAAGEFPVISTRNAETYVVAADQQTLAIGGLVNKSTRENISRIPILGYLPLVGLLFQQRINEEAKTEIVFLVTPRII